MTDRTAAVRRQTAETNIELSLDLDGVGRADVDTGLAFLDHMIHALVKHARFDLSLACEGDLEVDDHHTVEDCALALGEALERALGEKRGITRFGSAYAPLDEALSRAVVDLSGRPHASVDIGFTREGLGDVATENLTHFLESFATRGRFTLHVNVLEGRNDHHRVEAAFKSLALALRDAVKVTHEEIPSTKDVLE